MILNGIGGNHTTTGLLFENKTDIKSSIESSGFITKEIEKDWLDVYQNDNKIGYIIKKHGLYRFLKNNNIDWKQYLSKQILPDNGFINLLNNTLYIIECKFQKTTGSVDEKLQTCDFKKNRYISLLKPLDINVEYVYVLNDWFKQSQYKDTLNYINEKGCYYFFNNIPLDFLGLNC